MKFGVENPNKELKDSLNDLWDALLESVRLTTECKSKVQIPKQKVIETWNPEFDPL